MLCNLFFNTGFELREGLKLARQVLYQQKNKMNGAELVDPRLKSQHLGEAEAGGL
jgi:hypothetical protein